MTEGANPGPSPILFVIDGLWVGGTERSLAEMLCPLRQAGFAPVVACLRRCPDEGVERDVVEAGHEVRFLPRGGLAAQALALRRLIRRFGPRLVHSSLFRSNLITRLAAAGLDSVVVNSLVNTPYVEVRYRDPTVRPAKLRMVRWLDAVTGRFLVDHFHAVSDTVKRTAIGDLHIPEERITVIERGRDAARLGTGGGRRRHAARRQLELGQDDEILVAVGRQDFQKGHEHLLRAVAFLADERPRLRLLVAGRSGSASGTLSALRAELGLERRVSLLGHRDDLPEILAAADVFVFPSLFEGLPGAVIEAMALGLPIVASDIPPVREVVEEGGNAFLVPPASAEELASSLRRMLDDTETAVAFGKASQKLFEERFSLERSCSRIASLYRSLLEKGVR